MCAKVLLHVCCGPCATSTHGYWLGEGVEPLAFFYNPNIQPLLEFRRRLEGVRELCLRLGMPLSEDLAYDPEAWFETVSGESGSRCGRCLAMRLDRAAREAVSQDCAVFSTTLSISPWQDHDAIRAGGQAAAERHGVEFLYRDLRPLYRESRRLSREWGLYRQKYCGCLVSEWERYRES